MRKKKKRKRRVITITIENRRAMKKATRRTKKKEKKILNQAKMRIRKTRKMQIQRKAVQVLKIFLKLLRKLQALHLLEQQQVLELF